MSYTLISDDKLKELANTQCDICFIDANIRTLKRSKANIEDRLKAFGVRFHSTSEYAPVVGRNFVFYFFCNSTIKSRLSCLRFDEVYVAEYAYERQGTSNIIEDVLARKKRF